MANYFFIVFLVTIGAVRIFLFLKPISAPTIGSFRVHHYMYGLLGILIAITFHSLTLYAIGLGLFVDELTYLIIGGKTHSENYSALSLSGTVLFIVIVFFSRGWMINRF